VDVSGDSMPQAESVPPDLITAIVLVAALVLFDLATRREGTHPRRR
jgi:hypothetical protein